MKRRTFLSASLAAGLAPNVLTARDKSGTKNAVVGEGGRRRTASASTPRG
jgi:hypothetical protein